MEKIVVYIIDKVLIQNYGILHNSIKNTKKNTKKKPRKTKSLILKWAKKNRHFYKEDI